MTKPMMKIEASALCAVVVACLVVSQTYGCSSGAADDYDLDAARQELELNEQTGGEQAQDNQSTDGPKVRADYSNLQYYSNCGIFEQYGGPFNRIAGGSNTRAGEFPSIMAVTAVYSFRAGGNEAGVVPCTGVLVGPRIVLTAAHCIRPPTRATVLKDVWVKPAYYLPETADITDGTWTKVMNTCPSPLYDNYFLHWDVAVLILPEERAFWLNDTVLPICLPPYLPAGVSPNVQLWLVGNGRIGEGWMFPTQPNYPQKVAVQRDVCGPQSLKGNVPATSGGSWDDVHESVMCFLPNVGDGYGTAKACSGDSGGPIIQIKDGRQYLYGIETGYTDPYVRHCTPELKKGMAFDVSYQRKHLDELIEKCKGWEHNIHGSYPIPGHDELKIGL